jgi:hypothetical protein
MKRGEVITIHKDPITRKKVKGEDRLVRHLNIMSDKNLELWIVFTNSHAVENAQQETQSQS